jgi:uncharacterized protein YcbX
MTDPAPEVAALYRYPVKGLSPEPLETVHLEAGETFPGDRAFATENGPSGFDEAAPAYLPKTRFLMLMRNERLAALDTHYDGMTGALSLRRAGKVVAQGDLSGKTGRRAIEAFFESYLGEEMRGPARVLAAPDHSFSDMAMKCVSLINLASVRDLEAHVGAPVHRLRFRGNLYVEGLPAWSELAWIGRTLVIGGVAFAVVKRITRCAATNVDPETGIRDLSLPRTLLESYGHSDCGVYLKAVTAGDIALGDGVSLAS